MSLEDLIEQLKRSVVPTEEEQLRIREFADNLIYRLRSYFKDDSIDILLAGSFARGTNIKGSHDIDIFIRFPKVYTKDKLEEEVENAVRSIRNEDEIITKKYAEHPYIRLFSSRYSIYADIVPAYRIESTSERGSAVDRTPFHNEFVNSRLSKEQKDDVRVLKYILKMNYLYGAEVRVKGFSGYLCELLIYHYEDIYKLIDSFEKIKLPKILDIANRREIEEYESFIKRFNSRFIVIDPTDRNRNVAANLSESNLYKFSLLSAMLLREPSEKSLYLYSNEIKVKAESLCDLLDDLGLSSYVMSFDLNDIAEDILYEQIDRLARFIKDKLIREHFLPVAVIPDIIDKKGYVSIIVYDNESKSILLDGPPLELRAAAIDMLKSFDRNRSLIFIDNNKLRYIRSRSYRSAYELINDKKILKEIKLKDIKKESLRVEMLCNMHNKVKISEGIVRALSIL
ncbi:MAG: CCA-adding enzyme [Candidatus Micrarchaeota archaeon]|nr:MAG: CCA-adding enzyme [Candidatus Micrarchaeota archaeon]